MTREEQFRRNLGHAFDLLSFLIDHPDELARIPNGATLVPMPVDDPELCAANSG